MLEVQVGPAAQSESRTALKIIRDEAAPVSVLVSFAAVRERPQRTGPGRNSRSQTGMICLERTPTDLESVLETAAVHYRHRRPHKRRACGPRGQGCGQSRFRCSGLSWGDGGAGSGSSCFRAPAVSPGRRGRRPGIWLLAVARDPYYGAWRR